jgi:hypothetical protein
MWSLSLGTELPELLSQTAHYWAALILKTRGATPSTRHCSCLQLILVRGSYTGSSHPKHVFWRIAVGVWAPLQIPTHAVDVNGKLDSASVLRLLVDSQGIPVPKLRTFNRPRAGTLSHNDGAGMGWIFLRTRQGYAEVVQHLSFAGVFSTSTR